MASYKTNELFTYPGSVMIDDSVLFSEQQDLYPDFVFFDPPYENLELAYRVLMNIKTNAEKLAWICFMYPEDINTCFTKPDRICHWVKPVSTKNTTKNYSQFVEAIHVKQGSFFNNELHWCTRDGIFTDTLIKKQIHPHEKPFSLVEKLVLLHTPPGGRVFDGFCGSQVVKEVCDKHGFKSLSMDIKDWRL